MHFKTRNESHCKDKATPQLTLHFINLIKTYKYLDYFYPSPLCYHQDLSETNAVYRVTQMSYRFMNTKKLRNII